MEVETIRTRAGVVKRNVAIMFFLSWVYNISILCAGTWLAIQPGAISPRVQIEISNYLIQVDSDDILLAQ